MNALPSADMRREIEKKQMKAIATFLGAKVVVIYGVSFTSRAWAKKKGFI